MLDKANPTDKSERTAQRQRMRRLGARLSYWLIVAIAIVVTTPWTLINTSERTAVQNLLFDEFQRWRPRHYVVPPPIRVVEIDDASLAKLGRWQIGRAHV